MAQIFDIRKVSVGPRNFDATVALAPDAPAYTDEDPEGTELVKALLPGLLDHVCLGDASQSFGEVVDHTELAHLLEHVTVELLALTDMAGDVSSGRTEPVEGEERVYDITLTCPDDVLVASALSSAVWILQWAYTGGGEPEPDVEAIVNGIVGLVESLPEPEPAPEPELEGAPAQELAGDFAEPPATVRYVEEDEPQVVPYAPEDPDEACAPAPVAYVEDSQPEPVAADAPQPEPQPQPQPQDQVVEQLVAEVHAAADHTAQEPEAQPQEPEPVQEPEEAHEAPEPEEPASPAPAQPQAAKPAFAGWDMRNVPRPRSGR